MRTPAFFQRSELTATLWTFRGAFLRVGVFSLLCNLLMLTPTLYMLQVYDRVMLSQSELTLLAMSLLALGLFSVMACAEWLRTRVLVRAGMALDERLGTQVFKASFAAHLRQADNASARAFGDLLQVRQFLTGHGIFAFFDAPWAPIYLAVLFLLHPCLGGLGLVFALVQVLLAWYGHRLTLAPAQEAVAAQAEASLFLQGKLRHAEVIESMGMLGPLQKRWGQRQAAALAQATTAQDLSQRMLAWSKFIRYSQQSLVLGTGALLVLDGQLSAGGMIAANVLMTRALAPIEHIVGGWRGFIGAVAAFGRLEHLLLAYPAPAGLLPPLAPRGALELRGVVARAPGRARPILQDIQLRVAQGTVLVVMGPSGAGKSTLARVLLGIWPDVTGAVLLDGQALCTRERTALGPHLGYLPQDLELLEGTLAENIARFGTVDSARVVEAARATGLHEMILRFPKGYDTPAGEAGGLLSGGQRQRIGLARAVYGNPALVVLDEPNANLDSAGEAALAHTVQHLKRRGATVVLISHRPGVLAVADRVLLLHNGCVQAEGPRDAVLAARQAAAA